MDGTCLLSRILVSLQHFDVQSMPFLGLGSESMCSQGVLVVGFPPSMMALLGSGFQLRMEASLTEVDPLSAPYILF